MITAPPYPFAALVGQDQLKQALLLNAVDPWIGGVLIAGEKGTAKSTAARGLVDVLPTLERAVGCPFNCDPAHPWEACPHCSEHVPESAETPAPFVDLPLGATEDRVLGTLDLDRVLKEGCSALRPGLLAGAHRGVLYIDEVNLLPDHLVDVLLDAAASGVNTVQREGVALSHPARFLLVGTMNPEEGELRPQLLDRFGLMVEVSGPSDVVLRAEVVRRRLAFDQDPVSFVARWNDEQRRLHQAVTAARDRLPTVTVEDGVLSLITRLCAQVGVDGVRADLVLYRTARAMAALDERDAAAPEDVRAAAELVLPHRRRRQPFEQPGLDPNQLDQQFEQARQDMSHSSTSPSQAPPAPPEASQESETGEAPDTPLPDTPAAPEPEDDNDASAGADEGPTEVFAAASPGSARRIQVMSDKPTSGPATGRRNPAAGNGRGGVNRAVRDATPNELAVEATVRAAAQRGERNAAGQLQVGREDLHAKQRTGRVGTQILFVVDASGSMAARRRMEAVKGAVVSLLEDAYRQRDEVGVVAFRASEAELVLPPTRSVEQAQTALQGLPTGGRTPLAHGLTLAAQTIERASRQQAERRPLIVLLTDGKANVPLPGTDGDPWTQACEAAQTLAAQRVPTLVCDSEVGYGRTGRAHELAEAIQGEYLTLGQLSSDRLLLAVRQRSASTGAWRGGG